MALRGTDPGSYITEYTLVYEEKMQIWYYRFRLGSEFLDIRSGDRGLKNMKMRRFVLSYGWEMLSCHQTDA